MKKLFPRSLKVASIIGLSLLVFSNVTASAKKPDRTYPLHSTKTYVTVPADMTITEPETTTATIPETVSTTPETTVAVPETTPVAVTEEAAITALEADLTSGTPSETGSYFVSKEGSDTNIGSFAQPFKTIQKAADMARAGETVYIKGGTYKERVMLEASGDSTGYITFSNYPGEEVIIDGSEIDWGCDWDCLFDLNSQRYIKVSGLRVINSSWAGIGSQPDSNGCENVIVENCETYNTQSSGIVFVTGANITIDGNSVERACVKETGSQEGISLATVDTFTIKNNHVFNFTNDLEGAGGEGIDVKNGCLNGKIYGNTVNDIAKVGIYVDAYSEDQKNIEVYANKVYNCEQGITVAAEDDGTLENVNIHDNVIESCIWGMAIAGWDYGYTHYMNNITFNQNTLSAIKEVAMCLDNPDAYNVYITNNILGGVSGCIPICLTAGTLDQITIEGNSTDQVIKR